MKNSTSAKIAKSPRALISQGLVFVLQQGMSLNEVLASLPTTVKSTDKAMIQAGLYGVLRHYPSLSVQVRQKLVRPFKTKDIDLEYLLCFALFQLGYQQKPAHAVVHETVAAVMALGKPWAKAVVNAVLRKITDCPDAVSQIAKLNQDFDHPTWWQTALKTAWPDDWQAILQANNQQAPLILRINTQKISVSDYLDKLKAVGKIGNTHDIAETAVVLDTACPVFELPGFAEGEIIVQDPSAQMVAPLLELVPGLRVLDACAAPGGKTCHMLNLADKLDVVALEVEAGRTKRLDENLQRMQQKARIVIGDASEPSTWWDGKLFDRILADVPCSASGIIRRHPDIKFLRRADDLTQLPELQLAILTALWTLLAPGGILVYSTCSVFPQENDGVIDTWLKQTTDAKVSDLPENLGFKTRFGRQRLPGQYDMDGFYYAKIVKLS